MLRDGVFSDFENLKSIQKPNVSHINNFMLSNLFSHLERFKDIDNHLQELIQGASVAFVIKVFGTGVGFILSITLAQLLGVENVGLYYLSFTIISIGSVISRFGMDNALLRFIASGAGNKNWRQVSAVYRQGIMIGLIGSTFVSICVVGGASLIAEHVFDKPELTHPLQIMGLSIIPVALLSLHAEALKGLKHTRDAVLVSGFGVPFFTLLLALVLGRKFGLVGVAWSYVLATLLIFLISKFLWNRASYQTKNIKGHFDIHQLLSVSLPLFAVAAMNLVMGSASTVALGMWGSAESVGIYNVALRAAMLASFALVAVNTIAAPKFAIMFSKRDIKSLEALARNASGLMLIISTPLLIPLIFAPNIVLNFFGAAFVKGTFVLVVLAIGQFINLATGSVGALLLMCGYERLMRNNILVAMIIAISLNILLIPRHGALGAAIATTTSIAYLNIVSTYLVYRRLAIIVLPIPSFIHK